MADLHRHLAAEASTRIHVLNELVKEADDRLRALDDRLERAARTGGTAPCPAPEAAEEGGPPPGGGPGAGAGSRGTGAPPRAAAIQEGPPGPGGRLLWQRAWERHREGQRPAEIAAALGLTLSQVNMAIALAGGLRPPGPGG